MKRHFIIFLLIITFLSCKKDTGPSTQAKAGFSLGGQLGSLVITYTDSAFIIGTHDALILMNQSTNADSVTWNFGNGKTANSNNTLLTYDSAGNYTVELTAFNKKGTKSVASKKITVMERALKSFSINRLQLNKNTYGPVALPVFSKVNLWIEIKYSQNWADVVTSTGDVLAPVTYKSPVFTNIDSSFHSSLTYTLPDTNKIIINCPVNNDNYTLRGKGTIINLYAQNNSGTYLLASSSWSGLQVLNGGNPAYAKNFGLEFQSDWTTIDLNCLYQ